MPRDLNLDLGPGHMAYHCASLIDLYLLTKIFIRIGETLWTDGLEYVRTDGRTDIEAVHICESCNKRTV